MKKPNILVILLLAASSALGQTIQLNTMGQIKLLLIDPLGRKVGYDVKTQREYGEMPEGGFAYGGIASPQEDGTFIEYPERDNDVEYLFDPVDGQYILRITGLTPTVGSVNIAASPEYPSPICQKGVGVVLDSGMTVEARYVCNSSDPSKSTIKLIWTEDLLCQSLVASRKLNYFLNDTDLNKYLSLYHSYYRAMRADSVEVARGILNSFLSMARKDSVQKRFGIEYLHFITDDAIQLLDDSKSLVGISNQRRQ